MTADGEALQAIAQAIENNTMTDSAATIDVETLIDILQHIRLRHECDVSVGAVRAVLYDINDQLLRDIIRRSKQSKKW